MKMFDCFVMSQQRFKTSLNVYQSYICSVTDLIATRLNIVLTRPIANNPGLCTDSNIVTDGIQANNPGMCTDSNIVTDSI